MAQCIDFQDQYEHKTQQNVSQYPKNVSHCIFTPCCSRAYAECSWERHCNSPLSSELSLIFTYSPSSPLTALKGLHLPVSLCPSLFSLSLPLWCLCHILTASFLSLSRPSFPPPPSIPSPFSIPSHSSWCHRSSSPSLSSSVSLHFPAPLFLLLSFFFYSLPLTHPACHEQSKAEGTEPSHDRNKASWLELLWRQRRCDREDAYLWWFVYLVM